MAAPDKKRKRYSQWTPHPFQAPQPDKKSDSLWAPTKVDSALMEAHITTLGRPLTEVELCKELRRTPWDLVSYNPLESKVVLKLKYKINKHGTFNSGLQLRPRWRTCYTDAMKERFDFLGTSSADTAVPAFMRHLWQHRFKAFRLSLSDLRTCTFQFQTLPFYTATNVLYHSSSYYLVERGLNGQRWNGGDIRNLCLEKSSLHSEIKVKRGIIVHPQPSTLVPLVLDTIFGLAQCSRVLLLTDSDPMDPRVTQALPQDVKDRYDCTAIPTASGGALRLHHALHSHIGKCPQIAGHWSHVVLVSNELDLFNLTPELPGLLPFTFDFVWWLVTDTVAVVTKNDLYTTLDFKTQ